MTQSEFIRAYLTADAKTKQAVIDLLAMPQESDKGQQNALSGADTTQSVVNKGVQ